MKVGGYREAPKTSEVDEDEFISTQFNANRATFGLANVYYKTNLPLNKHFRHKKCLFRGRFVLYYLATHIPPNLGFRMPGINALLRGLTILKK